MSRALNWDVEGLDWPHRCASHFVQAAGFRWHVQQMGQGPLLLLLHGTGGASHSWRDLLPLLAQEFSCVALDLPGHGFTETPPPSGLSLLGMAESIQALLESLGLSPEIIVGHSAGAAIAAQLWLKQGMQARAIVSVNGAFLPLSGLAGVVFPRAAKAMAVTHLAPRLFSWHASDRAAVRRLIAATGSQLDARGEELYGRLVCNTVHVAAALGMMARWDVAPLLAMLPRLRGRLCLVAASGDRAIPPEQSHRVHKMVPGSTLRLIDRAGHLAHEESPDRAAALIKDAWLVRSPPSQGQRT